MVTIKVIVGSTRPGRFGEQPARWIMEQTKEIEGAEFELIDLAKVNLPLLDEPVPPMQQKYSKDHTKAWSDVIDQADGFVFVTAEYNHSIPAALKNAIDYLYHEWNFKPVSFVSYGSTAGGARVVEHLRGVAGETKMYDLRDQLLLPNYWNNLDSSGAYKFSEEQAAEAKNILQQTMFWAEKMKSARAELKG